MLIRAATADHFPQITALWNDLYVHDPITEKHLAAVIAHQAHTDQQLTYVATDAQEAVAGFVLVAVDSEDQTGYLQALTADDARLDSLFAQLIAQCETDLRQAGVTAIECCRYEKGLYFFPGLDVRYTRPIRALEQIGFCEAERLLDAAVDLQHFHLSADQLHTREKLHAQGITITPYHQDYEPQMRDFIANSEVAHWFPAGWKTELLQTPTFLACQGKAVLGYAQYRPTDKNTAAFGPVAVRPTHREQKIGTLLLAHVTEIMQAQGYTTATASWIWPPEYYLRNGWQLDREYIALRKTLS